MVERQWQFQHFFGYKISQTIPPYPYLQFDNIFQHMSLFIWSSKSLTKLIIYGLIFHVRITTFQQQKLLFA